MYKSISFSFSDNYWNLISKNAIFFSKCFLNYLIFIIKRRLFAKLFWTIGKHFIFYVLCMHFLPWFYLFWYIYDNMNNSIRINFAAFYLELLTIVSIVAHEAHWGTLRLQLFRMRQTGTASGLSFNIKRYRSVHSVRIFLFSLLTLCFLKMLINSRNFILAHDKYWRKWI